MASRRLFIYLFIYLFILFTKFSGIAVHLYIYKNQYRPRQCSITPVSLHSANISRHSILSLYPVIILSSGLKITLFQPRLLFL